MNKFNHTSAGFKICIDKKTEFNFSGRVYSQRLLEPFCFRDIRELITKIEFVLDKQCFPRAYEQKRSFSPLFEPQDVHFSDCLANGMDKETICGIKGEILTAVLYIVTRRSATWQGYISIENTDTEFNSVIELFRIINQYI